MNAVIASGMQDMFKYCHAPFVEACRGRGPAGTKDPEFINNTNEVLREGYDLLKEHFVSSGIVGADCALVNDAAGPLCGYDFFSNLMGLFERNNIDVEVKHPLEKFFRAYFAEARPEDETRAFEALIREKEVVMRFLWDDDMTGNHAFNDEEDYDEDDEDDMEGETLDETPPQGGVGACAGGEGELGGVCTSETMMNEDIERVRGEVAQIPLQELLQKENSWPAFHGSGFCPLVARCNHDCDPNIKIYNEVNDNTMVARLLKPQIAPGEQLTISYIDQKQGVEKRRAILKEYQFDCNCHTCVVEGGKI